MNLTSILSAVDVILGLIGLALGAYALGYFNGQIDARKRRLHDNS